MKPRLCRSSRRALASTHPLMLPSTCSREALLACPPFPLWNLPSFAVESTLSSPCFRSDPRHSRQGVALAHLDSLPSHDLVLWTDGSVPFLFDKGGSGVQATVDWWRWDLICFLSHIYDFKNVVLIASAWCSATRVIWK